MLHDHDGLIHFRDQDARIGKTENRRRVEEDDVVLALELMDYVVGTVHGQGYTRIFTTERYLPAGLVDADRTAWQLWNTASLAFPNELAFHVASYRR